MNSSRGPLLFCACGAFERNVKSPFSGSHMGFSLNDVLDGCANTLIIRAAKPNLMHQLRLICLGLNSGKSGAGVYHQSPKPR